MCKMTRSNCLQKSIIFKHDVCFNLNFKKVWSDVILSVKINAIGKVCMQWSLQRFIVLHTCLSLNTEMKDCHFYRKGRVHKVYLNYQYVLYFILKIDWCNEKKYPTLLLFLTMLHIMNDCVRIKYIK